MATRSGRGGWPAGVELDGAGGGRVRTPDGGDVFFRPSGQSWMLLRMPPRGGICDAPFAAPRERARTFTWDAPSRLGLVLRIASVWGLTDGK